ncbi:probable purple acid phosphatase 20 [Zingiber officinale]|uniref:probable purple acid phosphatase 20 n=1 Tax=Zingiber officinale TaxID=94328 RepID=UPI001C4CDF62|nr:probable purple acid phosphatase 20 [Zingiber officinale]
MRIKWTTEDDGPSVVEYGSQYSLKATGSSDDYSYLLFYRSPHIHDVVIGPLSPSTVYDYRLGMNSARNFSLKTPPNSLPFNFAVVGDLGQTVSSGSTLDHLAAADYDVLLLPGDLSYAGVEQPLWDSFGRLVEPLASSRPWMVTQGEYETERIPLIHPKKFVAYNMRWRMPYDADPATSSGSNLFYSFDVAGGAIHVIMLGSYADYDTGSPQQSWLAADLARMEQQRPQWAVAVMHAPWYNTNDAHHLEFEEMRVALEAMLYEARVDVVFSGHVHAYERFARVFNGSSDLCGPVHITIGDGGNVEGLVTDFLLPHPAISLFREASFGHGRFEVANATHALWTWHRNDDNVAVAADQVWITSLASDPNCQRKRRGERFWDAAAEHEGNLGGFFRRRKEERLLPRPRASRQHPHDPSPFFLPRRRPRSKALPKSPPLLSYLIFSAALRTGGASAVYYHHHGQKPRLLLDTSLLPPERSVGDEGPPPPFSSVLGASRRADGIGCRRRRLQQASTPPRTIATAESTP